MYTLFKGTPPTNPSSFVSFKLNERIQRVEMWLNQNFLLTQEVWSSDRDSEWSTCLSCLRDDTLLQLCCMCR
ncbi:Bardet-Biedl syndrome 2 protein homolog [Homalodisca vitripennis]|uniref:Bardet-Biedl syndrome 2 protein homolog n=1 Tax=Homalodisca vitripennis TaxID=197043 RepID=UPI001EEA56C2|nr:Bardet-Biedl syndrome 2 protein homolog [Homalodisca vitripennis]